MDLAQLLGEPRWLGVYFLGKHGRFEGSIVLSDELVDVYSVSVSGRLVAFVFAAVDGHFELFSSGGMWSGDGPTGTRLHGAACAWIEQRRLDAVRHVP